MVAALREKGITDERVLDAMAAIPRHLFGPEGLEGKAYEEVALPLGFGQTLSSPLTVARMLQALGLAGDERVLEIGTGSGYQTALLAALAGPVFTIERIAELADAARERLRSLGIEKANVHIGDGSLGWRAFAPFQAIILSAAAPAIPEPLLEQLAEGGRLVGPVGEMDVQEIRLVTRTDGRLTTATLGEALFVPLIGRAGWKIG
jgi:protein-L-isoaspartate(D-aspartate) O-methyltransferase